MFRKPKVFYNFREYLYSNMIYQVGSFFKSQQGISASLNRKWQIGLYKDLDFEAS